MPPVFVRPVAEPRGAAGGRSSNIIISVRRERPSSIVRPQPNRPFPFWGGLFGTCLWVALIVAIDGGQQPQRRPRRERVGPIAGRSSRGSVC